MEDVRHLLRELGARDPDLRDLAHRRLLQYGRRIVPLLRGAQLDSTEARYRVGEILRHYEQVELRIALDSTQLDLGARISLRIELSNYSSDTLMLPLQMGGRTPFALQLGDRTLALPAARLQVETETGGRGVVVLSPGDSVRLRTDLAPEDLPDRKAARFRLRARYVSKQAVNVDLAPVDKRLITGDSVRLALASNTIELDLRTRTPKELAAALDDPKQRPRALIELRLRDDEEVIDLLRTRRNDPDLRRTAVQRLGQHAKEADLRFIRRATRDPDKRVRIAATTALGHFPQRKARKRLLLLATDHELKLPAIRALARHKHAETVHKYLEVLQSTYREGPWVPVIQKALKEWTGVDVANRPSEIAAFRRWWNTHRDEWIAKNG
ncbi:MAG: HEAT repeat domain-containing protein [Planctomycetota bacterium]